MLIGIVGKPSSGKTTFLNASCLTTAKIGDHPFTTIKPNIGTAYLQTECVEAEFKVKCKPKNSICLNGTRLIPIEILDVAGLVPGAHEGRGLGNQFLSDLSRADALIHNVDISGSSDAEGNRMKPGFRDPLDDIKFLEDEIALWFAEIIQRKDWSKFINQVERNKGNFAEAMVERLSGLKITKFHILNALKKAKLENVVPSKWNQDDFLKFSRSLREVAKPMLIVANKIDQPCGADNYNRLKKIYGDYIIPASALAEYWLRKFAEQNVISYIPGAHEFVITDSNRLKEEEINALNKIKTNIIDPYGSTGIQQVLNIAAFKLLDLVCVYPVYDVTKLADKDGNILPDVFLVKNGTPIKEFVATCVHTELAEGFIHGIDAKTKMRLGESYLVKDKDVLKIVSAKGR